MNTWIYHINHYRFENKSVYETKFNPIHIAPKSAIMFQMQYRVVIYGAVMRSHCIDVTHYTKSSGMAKSTHYMGHWNHIITMYGISSIPIGKGHALCYNFEVKLTFEILTLRGQQHSFSTREEMFLWKCQSFLCRKYLDLRGTRTPNLRINAECCNHLSYRGKTFSVQCFWTLALAV